ncbi:MAG: sigma-54-dependent Fis family transcriptional regulator [Bacteroidetes bacterium]|nr:sigma-54-dependent Fis family transcriptional regulator [Bacteroidota bacterium]
MSVLISFVGKEDPYSGTSSTKPGPILALLRQRRFDVIYLLSTPGTNTETRATREAILGLQIESRVVLVSTGLEDQTDFAAIQSALRGKLDIVRRKHFGDRCWGFVTPGTQQMQAGWLSLVEMFRPWLRLLELRAAGHISAEAPEVREIKLPGPDTRPRTVRSIAPEMFDGIRELDEPVYSRRLFARKEPDERADFSVEGPAPAAHREVEKETYDAFETAAPSAAPDYLAVAKEVGIIGDEPCVHEMLYTAYRYAQRAIPVLITGETGTGKDLLARYIQRLSTRSERPYVAMNCAAITASLAESELFGVKKGAYTGADTDREGKFGAANHGTLFLDEIGDLPLEIQAKLLRTLENGEVQRVGDAKSQRVDVRVIAATNKDLHQLVQGRLFRDDLLSRLSVGTIHVPPLRDRRGDIPVIAQHLLDLANRNEGVEKRFTPEALQLLTTSSWERWNIRELRTAIERAWTMAEGDAIDHHHFKMLQARPSGDDDFPLPELGSGFDWQVFLDELRERLFTRALEMSGGNGSAAARLLGVSPQAVSQFQQEKKKG